MPDRLDPADPEGAASADATTPAADDRSADDRFADERAEPLSLNAQLRDAVRNAGIGQVAPGEAPSGRALVTAVGGVRGLAESVLPGFAFLIVYAITKELVPSVVIPVLVGLVFVVLRLAQRQSLAMSFAGILGVAISAGLALITGKAESNFIPGILINLVCLVGLLATLAIRRPLIGLIVGLLLPQDEDGTGTDWRADPGKRRVLTVATWLWVGLFTLRLVIEIPLYLTAQVELLAGIKLITGVPLYAAMLWVTWLLTRTVFRREPDQAAV
ncbi:DUF3159 domain-containing protein [Curtobacterium sp. VKM Ac-2865]|uniref:DUF3159 domain-containing protein n=1 Tax=Curtobacterium sp. VKM Ac-2865 TaxID=2783817 RepID=UPI002B27B1FC|nr:DUF3159 domain-containing protein [Curtobacterium sp. VKM Ac-2865]